MRKKSYKAFTMAELMIILLVVSLAMAAFMPIMTVRKTAIGTQGGGSSSGLWARATGSTIPASDIYYASNADYSGVAVGKTGVTENARLLINTDVFTSLSKSIFSMFYKIDDAISGVLYADSSSNLALGYARQSSSIGTVPNTTYVDHSIVIGNSSDGTGLLSAHTLGKYNISIGSKAIGSTSNGITGTIAIGAYAAANGTTTNSSIAIGHTATTGANGIAIGHQTSASFANGYAISIGRGKIIANYRQLLITPSIVQPSYSDTIKIGWGGGSPGLQSISIGEAALGAATNSIAIGKSASAVSNAQNAIAIGVKAKTYAGSSDATGGAISIGYGAGLTGLSELGGTETARAQGISIGFLANGYDKNDIVIGNELSSQGGGDGDIAIGGGTPPIQYNYSTKKLVFNGVAVIPGTLAVGTLSTLNLYHSGTTQFTTYSDKRLKNINSKFDYGLDKIRLLTPYEFTFKEDKAKTPQIGVVAQDLQKVFPGAVRANYDKFLKIRTDDILCAMVNSIKELNQALKVIKQKIQHIQESVVLAESKVRALIDADVIQKKEMELIAKKDKDIEHRIKELERTMERVAK